MRHHPSPGGSQLPTSPRTGTPRLHFPGVCQGILLPGLGVLFNDRSLWALAPCGAAESPVQEIADEAIHRWKAAIRAVPHAAEAAQMEPIGPADKWKPLGNQKAAGFLRSVDRLLDFARMLDPLGLPGTAAKAAWRLAMLGATQPADLTRLCTDTVRRSTLPREPKPWPSIWW